MINPNPPAAFHLCALTAAAVDSGAMDPAQPAALRSLRALLPGGDLARLRPDAETADLFSIERLDKRGRVCASVALWTDGATLADALAQSAEELADGPAALAAPCFDSPGEEELARAAVPIFSAYFSALQPPTA